MIYYVQSLYLLYLILCSEIWKYILNISTVHTFYSMFPFPYCDMFIACISWWIGRGITGYIRKYGKTPAQYWAIFHAILSPKMAGGETGRIYPKSHIFSQTLNILSGLSLIKWCVQIFEVEKCRYFKSNEIFDKN